MDWSYWGQQGELLLRLLVACACGVAIGLERQNRLKDAGIRTHLIVCLAAALIMIVSKYGFQDIVGSAGVGVDPSRIAAQVVSGVGFLGAGIIFVRKQEISGLTTAAGIWMTAAVGIALGAGMYLIGSMATVLTIVVQVLLHKNFRWMKNPAGEKIACELDSDADALGVLQAELKKRHIEIQNMKIKRTKDGITKVEFLVRLPRMEEKPQIVLSISALPHVLSVEI